MKATTFDDDDLDFDEDWTPGGDEPDESIIPESPQPGQPQQKPPKPGKDKFQPEDLDFAADCRALLNANRMRWSYVVLWLILIFLGVGIFWASRAELDEVTRGAGKVIPSTSVQVIQSLEGGLIEEIMVREGDVVEKSEVLLKIHDTQFTATYKESQAKVDVLQARMARLLAESTGVETITFADETVKLRPDLVKSEQGLFVKRREDLESGLKTTNRSLELAQREMDMTKPLLKTGAVSQIEVLRLERQLNELEGAIRNRVSLFQKQALEEYNLAKAEWEALLQSIKGYEDRVTRAVIRSPVKGTVNEILINTVGRVIRPGDDIMEIVPLEDNLLIEANIRPADIAFLHPGQDAVVKVTAFDFAIYGGLDGEVEHIGVDTIQDERGESFYQIKVRTDESSLMVKGEMKDIIPGMITEVDVLTGKKSVLNYLLKPINRARMRAMRER